MPASCAPRRPLAVDHRRQHDRARRVHRHDDGHDRQQPLARRDQVGSRSIRRSGLRRSPPARPDRARPSAGCAGTGTSADEHEHRQRGEPGEQQRPLTGVVARTDRATRTTVRTRSRHRAPTATVPGSTAGLAASPGEHAGDPADQRDGDDRGHDAGDGERRRAVAHQRCRPPLARSPPRDRSPERRRSCCRAPARRRGR